jgi:hypothetical protein
VDPQQQPEAGAQQPAVLPLAAATTAGVPSTCAGVQLAPPVAQLASPLA